MNFQQNHALCMCFNRKPEYEQAFVIFQQNFLTPLPCSSPVLGHVCSIFFLHHLFQSRFLDLAGQDPLCGGQIRARQRVILVQSTSETPALKATRRGFILWSCRWKHRAPLLCWVGSSLRLGCLAGGPLPAVWYNKHSSGYFVERLGLHFASSREAFMGCEYTTPFVTHSRRQNLLRSYRKKQPV